MARFEIGQEIVCVDGRNWHSAETNVPVDGPKTGELVHVLRYSSLSYIALAEYRTAGPAHDNRTPVFNEQYFEPVMSAEAIKELLEYQPETQLV